MTSSQDTLFTLRLPRPVDAGPWVRDRLLRAAKTKGTKGRRARFWKLTPQQIESEIIAWHESNAADLRAGEAWRTAGRKGRFRANTKVWIIPQIAMPKWAQKRIWNTTPYFEAKLADRSEIQIELQAWGDSPVRPWDIEQFQAWGAASHLPDLFGLQCLTETGIWIPFQGDWSATLQPNAAGLYDYLDVAQEATRAEIDEGLLTKPIMGCPLFPIKM